MKDPHFIPGPALAETGDSVRPGLAIVGLLAIGLCVVALPLAWISVLAISTMFSFAFSVLVAYLGRAPAHASRSDAVIAREVHGAHRAVLSALADLERAAAEAPRLRASMAPVLHRCRAAVAMCERMLQLGAHDRTLAHLEATRTALESFSARIAGPRDLDEDTHAIEPARWHSLLQGPTVHTGENLDRC